MDLEQIIELFESKHTKNLSDRHAQSIIQLCRQMDNETGAIGFHYSQLEKVARVFGLIHQGITQEKVSYSKNILYNGICNCLQYELIPALVALLRILQFECIKERSSDELYEVPKLSSVFDSICQLLNYDIKSDNAEEIDASVEWETARQEMACTIFKIAN